MLVGRPPFSPADFLDVYLEGGRVFAALSLSLDRPPRLTHDEALALLVGAQAVMQNAGPAFAAEVQGAVDKLEAAMTEPERARYRGLRDRVLAGPIPAADAADADRAVAVADLHGIVRAALEARQALRIDYFTASRDARTERVVEPYALLSHQGNWYLAAGPHEGEDRYKLFRLDRIGAARPEGEPATVALPEGLALPEQRAGGFLRLLGDAEARVRVAKEKARFAAEAFAPEDCHWQADGSVEIVFPLATPGWVSSWVLSYAPHARVLAPDSLRAWVREDARRALAHLS